MTLDNSWISEPCEECGSAFSLKARGKLHEEQSTFQKIEIWDTASWGKLMLIDGYTMVSTRDNFLYHEMMAHPVLYTHDAPRRVAIIGGGDCGTLREVLKHPEVQRVTQIDIDERVTRVAEQYFPELCEANDDPRAELLFIDGIQWIKDAPPRSLDVIIVDSTDPIGPGEVLFTPAFYAACHRALDHGGLLVQQSESPLVHLPILERMYRHLDQAGFDAVRSLFFPQPIYPTGWWSATLGRKGGSLEGFREEDVERRGFQTQYYNAGIHRAAFAAPEFFRRAVASWRS
jgi:spermidine synthase